MGDVESQDSGVGDTSIPGVVDVKDHIQQLDDAAGLESFPQHSQPLPPTPISTTNGELPRINKSDPRLVKLVKRLKGTPGRVLYGTSITRMADITYVSQEVEEWGVGHRPQDSTPIQADSDEEDKLFIDLA